MRPIWTGTISFGLVHIPVQVYPAIKSLRPNFKMLHKKDLSPIEYRKICKRNKEEVAFEDIVKGIEFEEGYYVVLEESDFKRADPEKTRSIKVTQFLSGNDIDPSYYSKPYFLEPINESGKAFALFREALRESKKAAFGQFVLRNREALAIIRPKEKALVLNEIRFSDELLSPSDLHLQEKADYTPQELEIAKELINKMTGSFKPEEYKDTYSQKLAEIIQQKAAGKIPVEKIEEAPLSETIDIMEKLKESLSKVREK